MTAATHLRRGAAALVCAVVLALAAGCAEAPSVPTGADGKPDAVLEEGRGIWSARCASCHGSAGGGGRGPKLADGEGLARHPEAATMVAVIADGMGSGMPAFSDNLTPAEIEAVVAYVREVLN